MLCFVPAGDNKSSTEELVEVSDQPSRNPELFLRHGFRHVRRILLNSSGFKLWKYIFGLKNKSWKLRLFF